MVQRDVEPLRAILAGRYRIEQELGRGGYATVYKVWNLALGRAEALKVLAPGHEADEDFPQRFRQEVRLAAGLDHPSIVTVYDFGETEGTCWYSMRLVEGRTLSAELKLAGPLEEREAARIALPLLDALDYSHERGIVHRDIKPENVIVDHDGRPFLMDFGIAKSAESLVKTQTGFLLGTPSYVAPEQAQGKPLDGRADLYALGVTLYRVVSGSFPFVARDPLQAVILRLTEPPRPLSETLPGVDPVFAAIVMRALEREPAARWESAAAMRSAFVAYLAGRAPGPEPRRAGMAEPFPGLPLAPDSEVEEATRLGPLFGQITVPTVVSEPPARRTTSALGAPSRRSYVVRLAVGFTALLFVLAATALVFLRPHGSARSPGRRPDAIRAASRPAPGPSAVPVVEPTAPAPSPKPTPSAVRRVDARQAATPSPTTVAPRRPVTIPERLTPEPPFEGPPPSGCSGAAITVGFAVDADGRVVAPRLFPSDAPPECERFVLEVLPRWRWKPAVDAAGTPVPSARLVALVRLP